MQIHRGCVLQRSDLLLDASHELRMRVPHRYGHDTREHVEVSSACFIVEVLHESLDDEQRIVIRGEDRWIGVLAPHLQDRLTGRTRVRARRMVHWRHVEPRCNRGHLLNSLMLFLRRGTGISPGACRANLPGAAFPHSIMHDPEPGANRAVSGWRSICLWYSGERTIANALGRQRV